MSPCVWENILSHRLSRRVFFTRGLPFLPVPLNPSILYLFGNSLLFSTSFITFYTYQDVFIKPNFTSWQDIQLVHLDNSSCFLSKSCRPMYLYTHLITWSFEHDKEYDYDHFEKQTTTFFSSSVQHLSPQQLLYLYTSWFLRTFWRSVQIKIKSSSKNFLK